MRERLLQVHQPRELLIESAGTGAWHIGDPPDLRMCQTATKYGVSIDELQGRQFVPTDFNEFDLILAMDGQNYKDIVAQSDDAQLQDKVRLFREWDPQADSDDRNVPDPYFGGPSGFDHVYDIVSRTVDALIRDLRLDT